MQMLSRLTIYGIILALLSSCMIPTPAAQVFTPIIPTPLPATAANSKAASPTLDPPASPASAPLSSSETGIHKIQHVVVIMQENRSFDTYFGIYPGADGIPMKNGVPTVCVPDPASGQCVKPYYDPADKNLGGPHGQVNAAADIDAVKWMALSLKRRRVSRPV
ncbi:MAG: alkaline phosphatase family protein [Anaerolineaceae bacterium]|nr:alkaline phosphatase family protein [Anaerolineaceae bacterium]